MLKAITLAIAAMFITISFMASGAFAADAPPQVAPTFNSFAVEVEHPAANFAGHFLVTETGCGTGCRNLTIVDLISGEINEEGFSWLYGGIEYYRTSELLLVNTFNQPRYDDMRSGAIGEQFTEFYRWDGSELVLVFEKSWNDLAANIAPIPPSRPEFTWKAVAYTNEGDVVSATGTRGVVAERAVVLCEREYGECHEGAIAPITGYINVGKCIVEYPGRPELNEISYVSIGVSESGQEIQFFPDQAMASWGMNYEACDNEVRGF